MPRKTRTLLPGCPWRPWLLEPCGNGLFGNETRSKRGRVRVNLHVGHRYANSAGWQWRYRLVVAYALGALPRSDEHVDHENGVVDDDRLENLRVLYVEYHGQLHARAWEMAGRRGPDGRWRSYEDSADVLEFPLHRLGPVLSPRTIDEVTWRPAARTLA